MLHYSQDFYIYTCTSPLLMPDEAKINQSVGNLAILITLLEFDREDIQPESIYTRLVCWLLSLQIKHLDTYRGPRKDLKLMLKLQIYPARWLRQTKSIFFKASALWADAFYKSKCPSVCVSVRLCVCLFTFEVPFIGIFAPTPRSRMSNI